MSQVVARLTHELRETTEQHTATSEILRVISSSPSDLRPVFQAMLKNALRLCDAKFGNIYRCDGNALHLVATQNVPAAFVQVRGRAPLRPSPQTSTGRMIVTKTVVHVADMRVEKAYADRDPYIVPGVELGGVLSALVVPMLKDDELIGSFSVYRQEVRAFTDKQIALCRTSQHKRSSPSRTRGCLMNCASAPLTSLSAPPTARNLAAISLWPNFNRRAFSRRGSSQTRRPTFCHVCEQNAPVV